MEDDPIKTKNSSFLEHYKEFRMRFIHVLWVYFIFFIFCFFLKDYILKLLLLPYILSTKLLHLPLDTIKLQANSVWETFITKMKLTAFSAFVVSIPYGFYQLYRFIAPGLYKTERRVFYYFLLWAPFLFLLGAGFFYAVIAPIVLWYSWLQQDFADSTIKIAFILKISNYLSFMTSFLIIFGLIFQLPLIAILLQKIKILDACIMRQKRRWAILLIALFAAIITPPDFFTMFLVFIPLSLLYEISILLLKVFDKNEKKLKSV